MWKYYYLIFFYLGYAIKYKSRIFILAKLIQLLLLYLLSILFLYYQVSTLFTCITSLKLYSLCYSIDSTYSDTTLTSQYPQDNNIIFIIYLVRYMLFIFAFAYLLIYIHNAINFFW